MMWAVTEEGKSSARGQTKNECSERERCPHALAPLKNARGNLSG